MNITDIALLVSLIIAVIMVIKNKIALLTITTCFCNATGRVPTASEIQISSEYVSKNIVKDIKTFFVGKH